MTIIMSRADLNSVYINISVKDGQYSLIHFPVSYPRPIKCFSNLSFLKVSPETGDQRNTLNKDEFVKPELGLR